MRGFEREEEERRSVGGAGGDRNRPTVSTRFQDARREPGSPGGGERTGRDDLKRPSPRREAEIRWKKTTKKKEEEEEEEAAKKKEEEKKK